MARPVPGMFEHTFTEENGLRCMVAKGRIDALSATDIQKIFDEWILAGERVIAADLASVHYISSAGLRAFVSAQKKLMKVGGEIILIGMTGQVFDVFRMSGLTGVFRVAADRDRLAELLHKEPAGGPVTASEVDGILLEHLEKKEEAKGSLFVIGSPDKTESSSYTEQDVVAVGAAGMPYGCGLAALGDTYGEYRNLFGESMTVQGSFFFYPAVRHSSVDFLIDAHRNTSLTYKFLHGFGFNGPCRHVLSFRGKEGAVALSALIGSFFRVCRADLLGVTLIAESQGIWGMHMKKVPLLEQRPANGKGIFDSENFSDWIDFPVDPSYPNHIVVATGIAARDRKVLGPEKQSLISEGSDFHLHGGIFEKAPMGNNLHGFNEELARIFNELQVYRVQHLLGRSRFAGGMAGIVELEA